MMCVETMMDFVRDSRFIVCLVLFEIICHFARAGNARTPNREKAASEFSVGDARARGIVKRFVLNVRGESQMERPA